jgi:hypothetical protein
MPSRDPAAPESRGREPPVREALVRGPRAERARPRSRAAPGSPRSGRRARGAESAASFRATDVALGEEESVDPPPRRRPALEQDVAARLAVLGRSATSASAFRRPEGSSGGSRRLAPTWMFPRTTIERFVGLAAGRPNRIGLPLRSRSRGRRRGRTSRSLRAPDRSSASATLIQEESSAAPPGPAPAHTSSRK